MSRLPRTAFYVVQVPVLIGLFHVANAVHRAVRGSSSSAQQPEAQKVRRAEAKVAKRSRTRG